MALLARRKVRLPPLWQGAMMPFTARARDFARNRALAWLLCYPAHVGRRPSFGKLKIPPYVWITDCKCHTVRNRYRPCGPSHVLVSCRHWGIIQRLPAMS